MKQLIIVGAGGYGRSVAEALMASDEFRAVGFLDDAFPELAEVCGLPVLGATKELLGYRDRVDYAVVAVGNNQIREQVSNRLCASGFKLATVIHPRAIVSPSALLGVGTTIMAGSIVGAGVRIGRGVIVNSGAVIDHDCIVEDFSHLGINVSMAGGSSLGKGAWMQAGSVLGSGVKTSDLVIVQSGQSLINC